MKTKVLAQKQMQSIFEQAAVGMVIVDALKSRFVKVNNHFCEMVGYSSEELLRGSIHDITHPDDLQMDLGHVEKISTRAARESSWEKRYRKKDGSIVWARVFVTPLDPSDTKTNMRLGVIEDITESKRADQQEAILADIGRLIGSTLEIDEVYERFVAEAGKMILFERLAINLINHVQRTVTVAYVFGPNTPGRNRGDSFPLKGSLNEAIERTRTGILLHPKNQEELKGQYSQLIPNLQVGIRSFMSVPLISRDKVIGVLHFRSNKAEAYKEQDLRLAEMIGAQIAGAIANAQLYGSLKKIEQELRESEQRYRDLSIVDELTRLYNSRYFYHQLKTEIDRSNRYKQPLTLLLFDIDNFKIYNDTYGHIEGDQVLWRLGHVVKRCLRETDFAFRYGGEEFTVLLPMTKSSEGAATAERIRTEFKKETFTPVPDKDVHVTVSIGLGQYREKEDLKAFVHRVDQLMYQGKKSGRDKVCSEP